jgi:hypothetical protein
VKPFACFTQPTPPPYFPAPTRGAPDIRRLVIARP